MAKRTKKIEKIYNLREKNELNDILNKLIPQDIVPQKGDTFYILDNRIEKHFKQFKDDGTCLIVKNVYHMIEEQYPFTMVELVVKK